LHDRNYFDHIHIGHFRDGSHKFVIALAMVIELALLSDMYLAEKQFKDDLWSNFISTSDHRTIQNIDIYCL
jgi:hypothetical protein